MLPFFCLGWLWALTVFVCWQLAHIKLQLHCRGPTVGQFWGDIEKVIAESISIVSKIY